MACHAIFAVLISFCVLLLDCSSTVMPNNATSGFTVDSANATFKLTDEGSDFMDETDSTSKTKINPQDDNNPIPWKNPIMISSKELSKVRKAAFASGRDPRTGLLLYFMSNGTVFGFQTFDLLASILKEKELASSSKETNETSICLNGFCVRSTGESRDYFEKTGGFEVLNKDLAAFIITMVIYTVMIGIGITGNILTLACVFVKTRAQNSTSVLISSLAVSDILTLGYCLPLQLFHRYFEQTFILGPVLCRGWYYIRYFSIVISTTTMAIIALDRYIAVCIPLHAKSYCTVARARIAVVVTWILSLAICSPVTLRSTFSAKNIPGLDNERNNCELSWSGNAGSAFAMSMLLVTFVLPLGAMLPAYLKVMKVLLRSSKSSGALQAGNGSKKGEGVKDNSTRSRMQVVKMLVVMLIVFVLCWGPLTIYEYLLANNTISAMPAYHRLPWFILSSVAFGNSFLNPVIYFTLSRTYREFMIWAMRRLFCCCPSVRNGGAKLRRNTTVSEVSSSVTYAISDEVPATPGGGNLKKQGTSAPDGAQR